MQASQQRDKSSNPPRSLSHYTTVDGLIGIVEEGCLWASNILYLNDRSELLHALGAASKAIEKLTSNKAMRKWSPVLEKVVDDLKKGKIPATYAICFCQDDDNLSQWRGYGGTIQGICITFDRERLSERLKDDNAVLYRVTYANVSTPSKLRDALKGELEALADLDALLGESSEPQYFKEIFDRVSRLLPKFKHFGFRDEREWRYVFQSEIPPANLCFRSRGEKIVPYVRVGLASSRLPIRSVRVGPGIDQKLTVQSLKSFFAAKGYPDVPVEASLIPFRP